MRKPRQVSESGIYHVIARGAGRKHIFEDDSDRTRYLDDLDRFSTQGHVQILAWCLMSNHVHLLLDGDLSAISVLMQTLGSEYAQYFNKRHDTIGPLFQGRFKSEPVDTDAYLLVVLRYIHENPAKAGIASASAYRWSSYGEYSKGPRYCDTARVLNIFGSRQEFIEFHENDFAGSNRGVMTCEGRRNLGEDALIERAIALLGKEDPPAQGASQREEG